MIRDPRVRFALAFGLWLAGLGLLAQTPWVMAWIRDPICRELARATSLVLGLFGVETTLRETLVIGPTGAVRIVAECDGVMLLCFFAAGVLAFPKPRPGPALRAALAGAAAILAANFARVLGLTATQFYWRSAFDFVHFYLLQGAMILVTTLVFLVWADRVADPSPRRKPD
jgi:exosortase/archaeosortase family protein